ncbi:MAG: CinA family nicotinamide mononucleotide deamidase-related protein [FCB group bacterium]|nr:CinA family nicotinamide mononucleotide deamidase-related protein [FCB group bacterium]
MTACIITIGDELLQGFTTDTNSAWIGQTLLPYGISIRRRITIPDDAEAIVTTVSQALQTGYTFIFVTGGLGPTRDDITKAALKTIFDADEYFDEEYYRQLTERFAKRDFKIPSLNRSQAQLLTNCEHIPNRIGTALGMRFTHGESSVFALPGVPAEMKSMIIETILPKYLPHQTFERIVTLQTTGIPESKLAEDVRDILDNYAQDFGFAFLPHHTGVNLRIRQKPGTPDRVKEKLIRQLIQRMGKHYFGRDGETLENVVGKLLLNAGKTLSVAESCTGGLLSKRLTDIPGSSRYFSGGVVSYSNDLKRELLDVPDDLLTRFGAVSEPVARAMAEGCRTRTGSDFALSMTGISGPDGGSEEKPVGLVFIALASGSETRVKKMHLIPERTLHREMTVAAALDLLRRFLMRTKEEKNLT